MDKILTIVVPSFNTEQFIDKNIPSFLHSDILDKLELLIINDGSVDLTEEKVRKYEREFPKTVKVINKENGGHGSVINLGIKVAKGRYFKIVDGDDWVETRNLIRLIGQLQKINCDMVINPYNIVYENNNIKSRIVSFDPSVMNREVLFDDIADHFQKLPIHCLTYKTEVLQNNRIKVRENCYYEDNEFCLFPIPFIESVLVLDYPIYDYLMGQKNQSVSDKNALKNRNMFKQVVYDCIEYDEVNSLNISNAKKKYISDTLLELIRSEYNIFLRNGFDKDSFQMCKKFDKELKEKYPRYHKMVASKYGYIGFIQKRHKIAFMIESLLMIIYRKLHIC